MGEMRSWKNKKMRKYINLKIRKLVLILLLCGFCHTAAFAYGNDRNDQSNAWGYQPVYKTVSYGSTPYMGSTTTTTSSVYTGIGSSTMPKYKFRTTSVLIPTQDQSESAAWMPGNSRPRRSSGWSEEDDAIGEVGDVDMPVGDTPWILMLLLVTAYYLIKRYRTKKIAR